MHVYTKLIILLFFLFIKLLFFRALNNFEETERIFGNYCQNKYNTKENLKTLDTKNVEDFKKHDTTSPILIFLYQPTDPVMNSVGNWLQTNSDKYFENNRFTSVHIFPVDENLNLVIPGKSLYEIMNQILKFETSFTSGKKNFVRNSLSWNKK